MSLSSSTLIHFTSDKDALKGILSDNFKIKYCKESITWGDKSKATIRIPMVSFCDIPLSQIKDHISKYGHYGIGLTREWAVKNKLNPVLYMQQNSELAISYYDLLKDIIDAKNQISNVNALAKRAADIARYTKNYEGPLTRRSKTIKKYRYSDEREWRYVPSHTSACRNLYTESSYQKDGIAEAAALSVDKMRLKFRPNDVKYIIIKNDKEISEFIQHLRSAKGKKYSHHDVERLTTRLFTSDQIHKDI